MKYRSSQTNRTMKKCLLILFTLINFPVYCNGQTVKNTSYKTSSGEKVLRLELTLPIDKKAAWKLFTVDKELQKWIAPVVFVELKTGGYMLTNYDKNQSLRDSSTIELGIINYLENELITLKVNLNDNFPASVQKEDENLQELIQFVEIEKGKTKIISSMIGWGKGSDWDKTYDFFVKGNIWTYEELGKLFK